MSFSIEKETYGTFVKFAILENCEECNEQLKKLAKIVETRRTDRYGTGTCLRRHVKVILAADYNAQGYITHFHVLAVIDADEQS